LQVKVSDPFDSYDPLTSNLNDLDPLTRMAYDDNSNSYGSFQFRSTRDTFEPWSVKKVAILNRFTTQEKLSITTSSFASEAGGFLSLTIN